MIPRYTRPAMAALWSEEAKFERWLEVELAHCKALRDADAISAADLDVIEKKAVIDVKRIDEIEAATGHDLIAFIDSLAEKIGPPARFIHLGLTSTDIVDTALALSVGKALDLVLHEADALWNALREKAIRYKNLVAVGRTHGIHAEPTTFGMKFAVWWDELGRDIERLKRIKTLVAVGKLSGAVGTYAETTPALEANALARLGLSVAPIATQVIARDIHADVIATLAIVAGTLEKIAVEIRHLQRTEVSEAAEPFGKHQKGSSAMPHKRNPVLCERVTGLARVVRNNAGVAFENQALWHERDISHSSAERIIIADSFSLIDFMLAQMTTIISGLEVNEARIARNLGETRGLIYSSRILSGCLKRGVTRAAAYEWVQTIAMKVSSEESGDFVTALEKTPFPSGQKCPLAKEEIRALFDNGDLLNNVDLIFRRLGIG